MNTLFRALLLDMDGVLYHGSTLLPGVQALLERASDIPHLFDQSRWLAPDSAASRRTA